MTRIVVLALVGIGLYLWTRSEDEELVGFVEPYDQEAMFV